VPNLAKIYSVFFKIIGRKIKWPRFFGLYPVDSLLSRPMATILTVAFYSVVPVSSVTYVCVNGASWGKSY